MKNEFEDLPEPISADSVSALATKPAKKGGLSKRKKADIKPVEVNVIDVQAVGTLNPTETYAILKAGLLKEESERSEVEQAAISLQSDFTLELCRKALEHNSRLDELHEQKIQEIEDMQRETLADFNDMIQGFYDNRQAFVDQANALPDSAVALISEAFGSSDPNE